jgi:hypothetical protein
MSEQRVNENWMKITEYEMVGEFPDLLTFDNGEKVTTKEDWQKKKAEMYKDVIELQYGVQPPAPEFLEVEPTYLGGAPSTYIIKTGRKDAPVCFTMTVFKASKEKAPAVITGDACFKYMYDKEYISTFLNAGIHFIAFNRTELAPDIAQYNINSLNENFNERKLAQKIYDEKLALGNTGGQLKKAYPQYSFGAVAAWAWGYSRCVDALEILGIADMDYIAFTGHSRGGKTCALAGALDERASIVNPNASCSGGYGSYRVKIKAEVNGVIKESEPLSNQFYHFPAWLGAGMKQYIDNEDKIPFDSHHLKAMVAPRTLFVSEAADDIMANPVGSYLTTEEAEKVFDLLDAKENLIWYFRTGTHYQTIEDISQLVNVIRHKKFGEPLNDKFFKIPFKKENL